MDHLRSVGIVGTGIGNAPQVLSNLDLEKMVETSDQWIRSRTGIRERRVVDEGTATSDLALAAAQKALAQAGVTPQEVDLIIVATITPDMAFPSTACIVQAALGAHKAAAFDLSAACSGFLYGLGIGQQFVATGTYDTVLVIGAETLSKVLNWSDRNTCVLFGDGAGACVLQPVSSGRGLRSLYLGADGSGGDYLKLPGGGSRYPATALTVEQGLHYIQMQGSEVYKFAVRAMGEAAVEAVARAGLAPADIDYLVPHQANFRIIEAAARRLQLPLEKVIINLERYGNMSAASVPVALAEAVDSGQIKDGDNLVLVGFGAGLTYGAAVVTWGV